MKQEIFKDFEIEVLRLLVSDNLLLNDLNKIIKNAEFVDYEYTGSGYYLTVRHPSLPKNRIVCSKPVIIGEVEGIRCGFIVFLENKELTIECHSWGELEIVEDFRDKNVEVEKSDKLSAQNL